MFNSFKCSRLFPRVAESFDLTFIPVVESSGTKTKQSKSNLPLGLGVAQYTWAPLTLWFEIVSIHCSPLQEQRKLVLKMLGIPLSHPKSAGYVLQPQALCGLWRSEFKSSHLWDKGIIHWAISLTPLHINFLPLTGLLF